MPVDQPVFDGGDWASAITGFEVVDAGQLMAHPANARRHPTVQRDALRKSLDRVGWISPVVVNTVTGRVLDGHARVEEAITRAATVPVVYVEVDEADEAFVLATFDPITLMATFDQDALTDLVNEVGSTGSDALDELLAGLAGLDPDAGDNSEIPDGGPIPEDPVSKPGDRWLLGDHVVVCGDSTNPETFDSLLDSVLVDALITDPPYGINYGETVDYRGDMGHGRSTSAHIANDGGVDALELWDAVFPLLPGRMAEKSAFYVWGPPGPAQLDLGNALNRSGLRVYGTVVWVKQRIALSRSDHKSIHEMCFYGWPRTHIWHGANNETSVWEHDRPLKSEHHPTQKPVDLIQRCVKNITGKGGTVLDSFLGSGTTLLACETSGRVCYGVELEPAYVDVICRRWQELTGVLPRLDGGGEHDFDT